MADSSAANPDVRVVLGGDSSPLTRATAEAQRIVARMRATTSTELRAIEREFQTRLGGAGRAVGQLQTGLGGMAGALSTARGLLATFGIAAGAGGLVAFGRHVFDTVANMGELAEAWGVTTEAMQVYQFVGDQTNVTQQNLQTGFARFNRTIGQATEGNDAAIASFRRLGVGILDVGGKLRPTEFILEDVARALMGIEDPALRALAAQELFGDRAGSKLLPMLAELAKGYDANAAAAKRMGAVIGDETIAQFDKASDAMARYGKTITAWGAAAGKFVFDLAAEGESGLKKLDAFIDKLLDADGKARRVRELLANPPGAFPDFEDSGFWPAPAAAPSRASLPQSKAARDAAFADAAALAAAEDKAREAAFKRGQAIVEADQRRNRSLGQYIVGLEDAARIEGLIGVEKEKARVIAAANNQLTDEYGHKLRELTALEEARLKAAAEAANLNAVRARARSTELQFNPAANFEERKRLLDEEYATGLVSARAYYESLRQLEDARLEASRQTTDGILLGLRRIEHEAGNSARLAADAIASGFRRAEDAAISLTFRTSSLGDALRNLGLGVLEDAARASFRAGSAPVAGFLSSTLAGIFHEGGEVGATAVPTRALPASLFVQAPRLHDGLMPDEFAAVLQRGETVIPKDGRLGGGGNSYHYTIYAQGAAPGVSREILAALKQTEDRAVARSVTMRLDGDNRSGLGGRLGG